MDILQWFDTILILILTLDNNKIYFFIIKFIQILFATLLLIFFIIDFLLLIIQIIPCSFYHSFYV